MDRDSICCCLRYQAVWILRRQAQRVVSLLGNGGRNPQHLARVKVRVLFWTSKSFELGRDIVHTLLREDAIKRIHNEEYARHLRSSNTVQLHFFCLN